MPSQIRSQFPNLYFNPVLTLLPKKGKGKIKEKRGRKSKEAGGGTNRNHEQKGRIICQATDMVDP
jgi:hypothetical protein